MFSTYCQKSRKASLSSYSRNTFRKNQDFHSFTRNKFDNLEGNQDYDTSNMNGISDNNPMCDSDSQYVEPNNVSVATKKMMQSRSYSNLLKSARFNSDKPSNNRDRVYSNKTYNSKISSDEAYHSSIHQCKPINTRISKDNLPTQKDTPQTYEFNDELDNCISNNSETMSSKFNGVQVNEKGFTSHSNISAVPNHYEEPNYSSTDEIAADIISEPKLQNNYNQNMIYDRYDTCSQERQLYLDTHPNALILQDICQNTDPTTVKNPKSQKMIQMLRNASGSQSTRNMIHPSLGVKRTVSINLYENKRDNNDSSPESILNKKQIGMANYNRQANSSKFSTLKKRANFARSTNRSNIENSLSK